jgi:NTE family protein
MLCATRSNKERHVEALPDGRSQLNNRSISLALQGGGSHGAFTWGVLDRLLEDQRIEFEGASGASAGAINAALLASGLTEGGRTGARQALGQFWQSIMTSLPNPAMQALVMLTRFLAPAQLNPLNLNPLRDILTAQIDFERLRRECRLALFVAATEIASGMPRIFRTSEMSAERCCSPRRACPPCTTPWRSTARLTGTAD